jgi:cell shape-determining protein MreD
MMVLYVLFLGWLALFAQMAVPDLPWFPGVKPALLALVVIYGALKLTGMRIYFVTTVLGFCLDIFSPNRLGVSVITLSFLSALIGTQRETCVDKFWTYQILLVLAGTFFYLCLDYCFYMLQVWHFYWPFGLWTIIALGAALNALMSPFFFALFNLPPKMFGWSSGSDWSRGRRGSPRYAAQ